MRIIGSGLIAVAVLLAPAPMAVAGELPPSELPEHLQLAENQAGPHDGVSMLAVSLTAGAAVAAAGSGIAQAVARRRALSRPPSQRSG